MLATEREPAERPHIFREEIIDRVENILPFLDEHSAVHDRDATFPAENFQALHTARLMGLHLSPENGGMGADLETTMKVLKRIASAHPSTALAFNMHLVTSGIVEALSTPEQRKYLHEVTENGSFIAAGTSEPGQSFRDVFELQTKFETAPTGFSIHGKKWFCSGASYATYILTSGHNESDDIMFALVKPDAPGITVRNTWNTLGMRATQSDEIIYEGAQVEDAAIIGTPGKPGSVLNSGRFSKFALGYSAVYLGIAEKVLEQDPALAATFSSDIEAANGLLQRAIHKTDIMEQYPADSEDFGAYKEAAGLAIADAKIMCCELAINITSVAYRRSGPQGMLADTPATRRMNDAIAGKLMPPSTEKLREGIDKYKQGQPFSLLHIR